MTDENKAQLEHYVADLFAPEDDVLKWIRAESARNGLPPIQIHPADGRLLQFLVRAINARLAVEIGALGGYSGTWIARALPPDGKLYTIEKSSAHAQVARASFARAGLSGKVELREGTAQDWLEKFRELGPFDFVFIDADKVSYPAYMAWAVDNLRLGGIVAAHNAFREGRVLAPESNDDRSIRAFNQALATDSRLDSMILANGDGMAVGIKKA